MDAASLDQSTPQQQQQTDAVFQSLAEVLTAWVALNGQTVRVCGQSLLGA